MRVLREKVSKKSKDTTRRATSKSSSRSKTNKNDIKNASTNTGRNTAMIITMLVLVGYAIFSEELFSVYFKSSSLSLGKPEVIIKQSNTGISNSAAGTERNGNTEEKEDSAISVAKNSATGTVFNNERIRTFHGLRYDNVIPPDVESNKLLFSNHTENPIQAVIENNDITNNCKRWGVVTTIFDPTEAITRVASLPDWCLVIVADTKTPDDYMEKLVNLQQNITTAATDQEEGINQDKQMINNNNIVFLTVEKQKELEKIQGPFGDFVRSTPWQHFCRKNIGYLFAVFMGAQFVFDFDDDNYIKLDVGSGKPLDILPRENEDLKFNNITIIMQGANAFNHHPIMGASEKGSWARGFPIDLIGDNSTQGMIAYHDDLRFGGKLGSSREVGVIQYLADGNPDIDAIHRLSKPLPMTFPLDGELPVLVPTHAYSPYNAQATIHTRNAMFAMFLPSTVPGRVSDIWRGYFAQCIFADIGLSLVFSPPKVVQERNDHENLADFQAEKDLYGKLVFVSRL